MPPTPTSLLDLPHIEARRLVARDLPVYLPVNPVEYHGPHLSLRNDHLVGMGLAADLHERLAKGGEPFLVASPIEAGVEPVSGPGTRAVSYRALTRLVVDACRALADLGVRRVVLVTFHGAPLHAHALDAGVRVLEARGVRAIQPFNLLMRELLTPERAGYGDLVAPVASASDREALLRELPHDFHAGYGETSLALHYAPSSVSPVHRALPPCPPVVPEAALLGAARAARAAGRDTLADELTFAAHGRGWAALRPFPGYTSRPHLASPETGAILARRLVDGYEAGTRAVFSGAPSPRPIMPWLRGASLGGLVPGMAIPLSAVRSFELDSASADHRP